MIDALWALGQLFAYIMAFGSLALAAGLYAYQLFLRWRGERQ